MVVGSVALVFLLSTVVRSGQVPLAAPAGKCLSGGARAAGYRVCCPTSSFAGTESIDGVQFRFTCATWAKPVDGNGRKADSAQSCAKLCIGDPQCSAASWFSSKGMCYLTTTSSYESYSPSPGSLLLERLEKTDEDSTPDQDCGSAVAAVDSKCKGDKETLQQSLAAQCDKEKENLQKTCQNQITGEQEQCRKEKAALEAQQSQALKDTDQMRQKATEDLRQCDAAKLVLEQQLQQCREDKTRPTDIQKPQLGACQTAGWTEMCSSSTCPEVFSVGGVEYKKTCNVATFHTQQALQYYNTPWECLEKECNNNSNCIGIGWVIGIVSCLANASLPAQCTIS